MTEITGITKLEKLEWLHRLLDDILEGYKVSDIDVERAMNYVEDIREDYMDDLK